MSAPQKIYVAGHRGMVGSAIVRQLGVSCGADFSLPRSTEVDPTQAKPPAVPVVKIDPRYFRPIAVETLLGDPTKAKQKLGWLPEITAQEMCAEMVAHDLAQAKQHALLKNHGYSVNVSVE